MRFLIHATGRTWLLLRQKVRAARRWLRLRKEALEIIHASPVQRSQAACLFLLPSFSFGGTSRVNTSIARNLRFKGYLCIAIAIERVDPDPNPDYAKEFQWCLSICDHQSSEDLLMHLTSVIRPRTVFCCYTVKGYRVMPKIRKKLPQTRIVDRVPAAGSGIEDASLPYAPYIDQRVIGNESLRQYITRSYEKSGYDSNLTNRLTVIYNGVSLAQHAPVSSSVSHLSSTSPSKKFVVGYVGRFSPEKGVIRLLEVAEILKRQKPEIRFVFVGDGPEFTSLRNSVGQKGLEPIVTLTGYTPDPNALMREMSVLLLPSLREGISNAALEAMALGKPVICTAVGGMPEVVTHGHDGFLVDPCGNVAADMAKYICMLASDTELADRMGKAARTTVEQRFNHERVMDQFTRLLA